MVSRQGLIHPKGSGRYTILLCIWSLSQLHVYEINISWWWFTLSGKRHPLCQLAVVWVETREGRVYRGWHNTVMQCFVTALYQLSFMVCSTLTTETKWCDACQQTRPTLWQKQKTWWLNLKQTAHQMIWKLKICGLDRNIFMMRLDYDPKSGNITGIFVFSS